MTGTGSDSSGLQPDSGDRLLRLIGEALDGCTGIDLEFSLRLQRGALTEAGRYTVWLTDVGAYARLLERLRVPACGQDQVTRTPAVRLGLGVAAGPDGAELRCYRHDRVPGTLKDRYRSWRWRLDGDAAQVCRAADYAFHFMPETPDGRTPLLLIDPTLRPAFIALMAEERFRLGSGFWLRTAPDGHIEQIDLALPWYPTIDELPGLALLTRLLEVPADALAPWRDLPIRHVAANGSGGATFYAAAPLQGDWPASQAVLQDAVRLTAQVLRKRLQSSVLAALPAVPAPDPGGVDLDRFYNGDIATWRTVLGDDLHYHAGLFATDVLDPSDAEMEAALRRAVTDLFPLIPAGGRVYDIGCGWGGPLAMLAGEHDCPTLGVTISQAQFRHVAALGLPVRWADAEHSLPPGLFDCALLLESFSHIREKARLLRVLRPFAGRLVMRVNCQDAAPPSARFAGSMQMVSANDLRQILTETGWHVRHWRDCRAQALPSVMVWHRRLQALQPTDDPHLEMLRAWCARVAAMPRAWGANNSLIEVMAE
jgi:Mycolic acid cyclopropane synthetase